MDETSSTSGSRMIVNQEQGVSYSDEYYVRSYTCNFCKKGFSNAQALGGHMNIHRRDRAKLRESSSSNNGLQPLDMTILDDTEHYNSFGVTSSNDHASVQSEASTLRTRAGNQHLFSNTRFSGSQSSHNIVGKKEVLNLFVDSPSSHQNKHQGNSNSSRFSKDDAAVDLELRLGSASNQRGN